MVEDISKLKPEDRQVIKKALELLRQSIGRQRAKEPTGSEIYGIRTRDIQAVDSLILRF